MSGCRLGADIVILSWSVLSEELTVPLCYSSGSINTDQVCITGLYLQHNTSLSPTASLGTGLGLVLYADVMARLEWREGLGALSQLLLLENSPLGVGNLTLVSGKAPLLPGDKLARLQWNKIP